MKVCAISFKECWQDATGAWFSDAYASERVPLLAEVLEWAKDAGAQVSIELKRPNAAPNFSGLRGDFRKKHGVDLATQVTRELLIQRPASEQKFYDAVDHVADRPGGGQHY